MQRLVLKFENFRVAVASEAIHQMAAFCQHHPKSREACGILLGYEWDHALTVVAATPPQRSDSRHRCGYIRDIAGHVAVGMELWHKSGGTIGYLGEWHTHPQRIPHPSNKDFREANKIAQKNQSQVVSVILGTTHGCGFIAFGDRISRVQRFEFPSPRSMPLPWPAIGRKVSRN